MRVEEARDLGRLSGSAARGLTRTVHGIHTQLGGVTERRVRRWVGPAASPVLLATKAVTDGAYAAVGAGRDVPVTGDGLAGAFPDATPALAIFLHKLGESEVVWRYRGVNYPERLRRDLGMTPILSPADRPSGRSGRRPGRRRISPPAPVAGCRRRRTW